MGKFVNDTSHKGVAGMMATKGRSRPVTASNVDNVPEFQDGGRGDLGD